MFKKYWSNYLTFSPILGGILILFFGLFRFIAVLYGIHSGNNQYLSFLFLAMILFPFLFLSKEGRRYIGIKKPSRPLGLLYSFLLGLVICFIIFLLGKLLYGNTLSNWFQYIGHSYPIDLSNLPNAEKSTYFIIFVLIGMTFSPLGEELFYRGVVHGMFQTQLGGRKAALIDSAAFGITHLAHFGIIYNNQNWSFLFIPALIWITLMFLTGLIFNYSKVLSGSIAGAILSHMAFNMMMTYLIFYHLF